MTTHLHQWGDQIQRSVLVYVVVPDDLSELIGRVEEIIDPATNAVRWLPTYVACRSRLVICGQADATSDKPCRAAL